MISFIQAVDVLKAFADGHLQVKKFGFEFKEQMQNLATVDEKYPYLFVVPVASNPLENVVELEMDIYCVDRLQKDRTNTKYIVSDTQLILTDLAVWLEESQDDIEVVRIYPQTPINNDLLDYVAGWVMRLRVQVERIAPCEIPFDGEQPTPPVCASGLVQNSDESYSETVASGGVLNIPDVTITIEDQNGDPLGEQTIPSVIDATIEVQIDPTEIDVTVNNETFLQGVTTNQDILLVDQFDNELNPTITGNELKVTIPPCADANIEINNVPVGIVGSGDTIDIPVLLDGAPSGSWNGTEWVVESVPNEIDITLNGNPFLTDISTDQNITLVDQDGNPIVPVITGNEIEVTLPVHSQLTTQTGATTSYVANDDGALKLGRLVDFFTLPGNNPFGNTNRFTDVLGGQTYANHIVLDWAYKSDTFELVHGWDNRQSLGASNVATFAQNMIAAAGATIGGLTGWNLPNRKIQETLINSSLTNCLNYAPFSIGNAVNLRTTTQRSSGFMFYLANDGTVTFENGAFTGNRGFLAFRYITYNELGL